MALCFRQIFSERILTDFSYKFITKCRLAVYLLLDMFSMFFPIFLYFRCCCFLVFFMQVAWHTRPEGHFKAWATITIFSRGRCHLLLGLKQGCPFYSPYGCRLGYYQSKVWPVEQKALPPQFRFVSVYVSLWVHMYERKKYILHLNKQNIYVLTIYYFLLFLTGLAYISRKKHSSSRRFCRNRWLLTTNRIHTVSLITRFFRPSVRPPVRPAVRVKVFENV